MRVAWKHNAARWEYSKAIDATTAYQLFSSLVRQHDFANMTKSHHDVFVLWGQGFDEIAASIFVGGLRRLGIRVKVVGLNSQQITGRHGLALVPDLTLGQSLDKATGTRCIIIPAPLSALQQFSYDPRLAELLQLAAINQALLVMDALPPHDLPTSNSLLPLSHNGLQYPPVEELLSFVQTVLMPRIQERLLSRD